MSNDTERTETLALPGTLQPTWAKLSGPIELVVKAVAIGVPVLYATGRIYSEAYWSELRIPPSLLEYAVADYLYLGFVAIASGLASTVGLQITSKLGYLALFALGVGAAAVGASVINRSIGEKIRTLLSTAAQYARDSVDGETRRHFAIFGAVSTFLFALIYVVLAAVLLLLLPLALISRSGSEAGKRERAYQGSALEIYSHGTPPKSRMRAHYSQDGQVGMSRLVECGHSWCVVFEGGAFVAIPAHAVFRVDQEPRVPLPRAGSEEAPTLPSGEARDQAQPLTTEPRAR